MWRIYSHIYLLKFFFIIQPLFIIIYAASNSYSKLTQLNFPFRALSNQSTMPFTPFEESLFNYFNRPTASTQTEDDKRSILSMFLCRQCFQPINNKASIIFKQQTMSNVPYIICSCSNCSFQWVICCLCTNRDQPKLPSKTIIKRNRHRMIDYLTTSITSHTSKHHPNHSISCTSVPSLNITNIESSIEIDSNVDNNHSDFDNNS